MYHSLAKNTHKSKFNVQVDVDVGATADGTARLIDRKNVRVCAERRDQTIETYHGGINKWLET